MASPQVTTEPLEVIAAKACRFGNCLPLPAKKTAPDPGRSFGRIFGGLAAQSAYWARAGLAAKAATKAEASKQALREAVRRRKTGEGFMGDIKFSAKAGSSAPRRRLEFGRNIFFVRIKRGLHPTRSG